MALRTQSGDLTTGRTTTGRDSKSVSVELLPSVVILFIIITGGTATVKVEVAEKTGEEIAIYTVNASTVFRFPLSSAIFATNVSAISGATVKVRYRVITGDNLPDEVTAYAAGTVIPGGLATFTTGAVLFAGSTGVAAEDSANFFWDDTNNLLGIGTTAPAVSFDALGGSLAGVQITRADATVTGGIFIGRKARGTAAAPTQALSGDSLMFLSARGYHSGGAYSTVSNAAIGLYAAENFTSTAQGTHVTLETTPTGSVTRAERFRAGPAGQWGIGGATYGTAGQYFRSGGAAAAPTWASIDHGSETAGLSDDDHTQYALLAGRSGGQTLNGGTASGNNLTLESTTHATKGLVDATSNLRFGIASGAASSRLVGRGEHTSAPAASLATGEWEMTLYDDGVTPVVRFRYSDGGVTKTVDVGPLI